VDDHSGLSDAWTAARNAATGLPTGGSTTIVGTGITLADPNADPRLFSRLSYDPQTDLLIFSNGASYPESFPYNPAANVFPRIVTHCLFNAASLDPAGGALTTAGFNAFYAIIQGSGFGFFVDPNTGNLFQCYENRFLQLNRSGFTFGYGYGSGKIVDAQFTDLAGSPLTEASLTDGYVLVQAVGFNGELALNPTACTNT